MNTMANRRVAHLGWDDASRDGLPQLADRSTDPPPRGAYDFGRNVETVFNGVSAD